VVRFIIISGFFALVIFGCSFWSNKLVEDYSLAKRPFLEYFNKDAWNGNEEIVILSNQNSLMSKLVNLKGGKVHKIDVVDKWQDGKEKMPENQLFIGIGIQRKWFGGDVVLSVRCGPRCGDEITYRIIRICCVVLFMNIIEHVYY
jgi:hypothetical protein